MCIFGGGRAPAPPPPLPPAPEPPKPPAPPPEPEVLDTVNTQVKRAKDDRGNKQKNQYSRGTGSLRIKLNESKAPKVNTGTDMQSGGLN